MSLPSVLIIILIVFLSQFAVMTQAWGTLGHEIVGNLAWYRLSDQAKLWVNDTLKPLSKHHGSGGSDDEDDDPTMTPLGQVADWADQVRHYLGWSSPLHFIDVRDDLIPGGCVESSKDCRFEYERDCVNDMCVAGAILNYTQQLLLGPKPAMSPNTLLLRGGEGGEGLEASRLGKGYNLTQALMFLTHFIGDIHQPLHASRTTDKGGNDFHVHFNLPDDTNDDVIDNDKNTRMLRRQLRVQMQSSHHHAWNLHSVWDTGMIEVVLGRNYNHSRHLMEQDLLQSSNNSNSNSSTDMEDDSTATTTTTTTTCNIGINATCVIEWGKASFDLALLYAYVESDNVTQVSSGSTLDELYYESRLPIVKQQLILGGIRLAETIEAIVATTTTSTANRHQHQQNKDSMLEAPSKLVEVWKTLGLATLR